MNIKRKISNTKWFLITIEDPCALPGESFIKLFEILSSSITFKFVILNSIFGAPKKNFDGLIWDLQAQEGKVLPFDKLLNYLKGIEQFDWADFFLFKNFPEFWNDPKGTKYDYVISQTDMTVRAVDDQYIYVYTPHKKIADLIKEKNVIESEKIDILENLEYPE